MSPEGYILMAEMFANNELDIEGIMALVRKGMAERRAMEAIDAWLDTLPDEPLPPEQIEAIVEKIRQAHQKGEL